MNKFCRASGPMQRAPVTLKASQGVSTYSPRCSCQEEIPWTLSGRLLQYRVKHSLAGQLAREEIKLLQQIQIFGLELVKCDADFHLHASGVV